MNINACSQYVNNSINNFQFGLNEVQMILSYFSLKQELFEPVVPVAGSRCSTFQNRLIPNRCFMTLGVQVIAKQVTNKSNQIPFLLHNFIWKDSPKMDSDISVLLEKFTENYLTFYVTIKSVCFHYMVICWKKNWIQTVAKD